MADEPTSPQPDVSGDGGFSRSGSPTLSWPIVERRQRDDSPPGGLERRSLFVPEPIEPVRSGAPRLVEAPPLAPFRWSALLVSLVVASGDLANRDLRTAGVFLVLVAYAAVTTARPIPYRDDRPTRTLVGLDVLFHMGAVMLTGDWKSPFSFTLIPSTLLAGFASGPLYSIQLVGAAAGVISARYLSVVGIRAGIRDTAAWCGMLALVALTSGLSRRVSEESARQQMIALDRLSRLAEANALLFSLQRVAQTLPASLDLDDVLDSTLSRLRTLIDAEAVTVLLYSEADRSWDAVRTRGYRNSVSYRTSDLPAPLREAMLSSRAVAEDSLSSERPGIAEEMRSGLYASLRARGALIGLIAVESKTPNRFNSQHSELLNGFIEPFGIAIDNARLFRRLRSVGADEERNRIARELHDRIGNSLAVLGFEIDRVGAMARRGDDGVDKALVDLRGQVTSVVGDVREALYDLRTDVSEAQDLVATLQVFLDRVRNRTSIEVRYEHEAPNRLPILQERELWQIAKEAITNAERHAESTRLTVSWRCNAGGAELAIADNGRGFAKGAGRPDSYGLLGMRERAASVGGVLDIASQPGRGTTVTVTLGNDTGGTT